MAAQGQMADTEQHRNGGAMKRRGILSAAGAALGVVMAGVAAKQTVQPVAASTDTFFSASGSPGGTAFSTSGSTYNFGVAVYGASTGVSASSTSGTGIDGNSSSGTGVSGTSNGNSLSKGVYGHHTSNGYGVYGDAGAGGYGVTGVATTGRGVYGQGTTGEGVSGFSVGGNAVYGYAGAAGTSTVVAGVFGDSATTYGLIGRTTASGYSGLTAITSTAGVAALAATSTTPSAFAAFFTGKTIVSGDFIATGGVKSAAVKDASGQHRLVYCVESPESWFEDFGKGTLVNGKADIKLDPVFTQIAHTDAYHVFLTPHTEDGQALAVTQHRPDGFVVTERNKGTSSGTFSYRVVARRADIKGERLATFEMPKIKIPDESKLPKPEPSKKA